jgi:hypothetical protein
VEVSCLLTFHLNVEQASTRFVAHLAISVEILSNIFTFI